jgi:hypothetical protein
MSAFASTTSAASASLTITSSTGASKSNNAHGAGAAGNIPFSPSIGFDPNRCDSDFGGNESSSEETSTIRSRRRKKRVNYCEMGVAADGSLLDTNGETIYGDENEKSVAMAKQCSIGAAAWNGKSSEEEDNLLMGEGGNDDVTVRKSSTVKKSDAKEKSTKKSVKKKKQTTKAQLKNEKVRRFDYDSTRPSIHN